MKDIERKALYSDIQRLVVKVNEIISLMKIGQWIAAYEKVGGILKILNTLGSELKANDAEESQQSSSI